MQKSLFLTCLFIFSVFSCAVKAQFHSINYAAEHTLEAPAHLTQSKNGQIWLFADNSVSLFTGDQFVSYQSYALDTPIRSGIVLTDGFIFATDNQIFFSNRVSNNNRLQSVWQSGEESIISLYQSNDTVFVQTTKSVYAISQFSKVFEVQQIYQMQQAVLDFVIAPQAIYILNPNQLVEVPLDGTTENTFELPNTLVQLGVDDSRLFGMSENGDVVALNINNQNLQITPNNLKASRLLMANGSLYLLSGKSLFDINSPNSQTNLPLNTEQVFIDKASNLWLLTAYDVQVQWQQQLQLSAIEQYSASRFDLQSAGYAMQQGSLYQQSDAGRWQLAAQLPERANSEQLLTTRNHLWFVKQGMLLAIDKRSYVKTFEYPLPIKSWVLKSSNNKVAVIDETQIIEFESNGIQQVIKTCDVSCLPNYKINQHLWDGNKIWLATSYGLHQLSLKSWQFSSERADGYNSLSPVLGVNKDNESNKLWLLYPNKIALFDSVNGTSEFYFSNDNRLFSLDIDNNQQAIVLSQRGWFEVTHSNKVQPVSTQEISLLKFSPEQQGVSYWTPDSIMQLTSNEEELRLGFNLMKQHSEQAVYFRFKYEDELNWSESIALSHSVTIKKLRQGSNQLLVQARLEGQEWSQTRLFNYEMAYKYLQTKWVLFYASLGLLLAGIIYIFERYKRIRVIFSALKQESFITSLLESTKDGVWVANKDRAIQSVNHAFCDISGFEEEEVVGNGFQLHTDKGRNHELETLIWQEVIKVGFWSGEIWTKKKSGEDISMDLSVTRVETQEPLGPKKDIRYVGVFSDVTARKTNEKAMRQLATRDPLTELSNRTLFIELIEQSIATANPKNPNFAVVFLDLDNFSKVNANLGPLQGDKLIKKVADRLADDLDKGLRLARLAADEFAFLVPNHLFTGEPAFYIRRLASEVKRKLQPSFMLDNTEVSITASLGVAYYPIHGLNAESLMRCADTALKKVKQSGKNNFLIYEKALDNDESELLSLESELIRALDNDEFRVYFQPKYLLDQHVISGYEALVRWQSPTRGMVPPDQFIGLAEQNGLIRQVDATVLKKVCEQIQIWQKQGVDFNKVAVNVSALNFQQMEFGKTIHSVVSSYGISPSCLELEITESAMMSDPDQTLANLNELRSLGFTIALDDFGTGHSSLGHLKYFPIDRLKIDRTFVKDIDTCDLDKNLVSVTIQLAKHLGIKVIAEGVENKTQAYILHVLGCNEVQGFMISKPLPAEEVLPFIQERMAELPDIALD